MLPLQGAGVQSLVGELRSCMPHGAAKKKKRRKKSCGKSAGKNFRVMKDRPPWEAMKGFITWRKYGLRNMSRGQLEEEKEITCSKV